MEKRTPLVLIIDDDPDITESMRIVLESGGYTVRIAPDGEQGLKLAEQSPPDLVILDVMMTRADEGFDVCRSLKKRPSLARVPILMLTALREKTGFDFRGEAGDADWLPADDYMDKPIRPDDLIARVRKLIGE